MRAKGSTSHFPEMPLDDKTKAVVSNPLIGGFIRSGIWLLEDLIMRK